jgi:hypothetical protein
MPSWVVEEHRILTPFGQEQCLRFLCHWVVASNNGDYRGTNLWVVAGLVSRKVEDETAVADSETERWVIELLGL